MANATVSRVGQVEATGDAKALFLKVFSGEVMTAFEETNVMLAYTRQRQISSGKSAQFPVIGKTDAAYHTPGAEIVGRAIKHNEVVITIDDLLLTDAFIANIDEAMNHYDVRAPYSREMGRALARVMDKQLLQMAVLGARSAARISDEPGGATINDADIATNSDSLIATLFDCAQLLDEKDVPSDGRVAVLPPALYYALAENTKVMNKDWGGAGTYADGKVLRVAGIEIVKSNNVPSTTIAGGTTLAGTSNKYAGNFTTTKGVVLQREALGTLRLLDLAMESEYDIRRQGTLMVAKYAVGHGVLAPQCLVELRTADPV